MTRMTWLNEVTGSDAWWQQQQQQGIPLIEPGVGGSCQVTFFWRDPQGDEAHSATQRVWINITGVTDHHQSAPPSSFTRVPHTDVWWWQTTLPADWRGSYCLMPDQKAETFTGQTDMQALRQWWREKFPSAQADPLNPLRGWAAGRGMQVSPLHLPQSPDQSLWHDVDRGNAAQIPLQSLQWCSERLGNQRRVWIYCSGDDQPGERPLALLLDGQFWAQTMPIAGPLQQLTVAGELPPAVYVMIDIIDREHRSRELTCNPEFWLAVQHELLPLIQQTVPCRVQGDSTLVAGQSFGGLSAAYATLSWPETFAAAISLSGSFWWPARGNPNGWLPQQLQQGLLQAPPRRFYLEAGQRERLILAANQQFEQDLIAAGHQVSYHSVEGGHDALCWRGGLLAGLKAMWQYPSFAYPPLSRRGLMAVSGSVQMEGDISPGDRGQETDMQHLNPFDDPHQDCHVLINSQQQYSLWPAFRAIPPGWQPVFGPQSQALCLSWLNEHWHDIRPVTASGSDDV